MLSPPPSLPPSLLLSQSRKQGIVHPIDVIIVVESPIPSQKVSVPPRCLPSLPPSLPPPYLAKDQEPHHLRLNRRQDPTGPALGLGEAEAEGGRGGGAGEGEREGVKVKPCVCQRERSSSVTSAGQRS